MVRDKIKIDLLVHDLKVPLAVIDAGISALLNRPEKYGPLTDKQEKVLRRALRNTKVTQTLVNDALELARSREGIINVKDFTLSSLIESALVEIFDLADCDTSDAIKSCTHLPGIKSTLQRRGVFLSIEERLWCQAVCMDETKMRQILRNLLNNALKFRRNRIDLEISEKDGCLVLSVKDDGEGIPSTYHKKIFESYFQMDVSEAFSVRGHGLGLAGVMVLVEDLRGKLSLESDSGKGAKFSVEVPFSNSR